MAIIFHSDKYQDIKIDSHMIIGVLGDNSKEFLKSLTGDNVFYLKTINGNKKVSNVINEDLTTEAIITKYIKELGLNEDFLNYKLNNLSHSEKRLLGYLQMLVSDANIFVIDEPFLDLDYNAKKKIRSLFNQIIKTKTIIISSNSSDVIYSICKKVLLLGKEKFLYDEPNCLANKSILKRFNIKMPEIIEFVRLANDNKAKLSYSNDVRDLIKDVYRHVSK